MRYTKNTKRGKTGTTRLTLINTEYKKNLAAEKRGLKKLHEEHKEKKIRTTKGQTQEPQTQLSVFFYEKHLRSTQMNIKSSVIPRVNPVVSKRSV
jgi:hypothetical protein